MNASDKKAFGEMLANVYSFYRQDSSVFANGIWWEAMKPFDLGAVKEALNRHCVNPDTGQYLPKPADVVRMLQGGTLDQAAQAWAKVDRAVRSVGTYEDVVFDDPLIHRVIAEMGGWVWFGQQKEDEWPFIAKRFETLYRGYRARNEVPEFPKVLIGIANSQNSMEGKRANEPTLIGDANRAQWVRGAGGTGAILQISKAAAALCIEGTK